MLTDFWLTIACVCLVIFSELDKESACSGTVGDRFRNTALNVITASFVSDDQIIRARDGDI